MKLRQRTKAGASKRPKAQGSHDRSALIGHSPVTPYLFSAPAFLVVSLILAFPVVFAVYRSLFQQRAFQRESPFVGLGNYAAVLTGDGFWAAFGRSLVFFVGVMTLGTVLSLLFAFALLRVVGPFRALRSLTLLPYIVSGVATATMFRVLFNRNLGLPNQLLGLFGIEPLSWLADPNLAMIAIIVAQLWGDLPLSVLLIFAGLQTIDPEYLDAASVDGATGWKRARHISIPLVAPQIALATVFLSYGTLTAFGVVLTLTGGGPGTATEILGIHMYKVAFRDLDMGQGLAITVLILLINAVMAIFIVRMGRARNVE